MFKKKKEKLFNENRTKTCRKFLSYIRGVHIGRQCFYVVYCSMSGKYFRVCNFAKIIELALFQILHSSLYIRSKLNLKPLTELLLVSESNLLDHLTLAAKQG